MEGTPTGVVNYREGCLHISFVGASLSEPHTSVTAFAEVVCMYVCLFAAIYCKF